MISNVITSSVAEYGLTMVEIKFHSIYNDLLKSVVLVAGQMPLVEIFGSQHWIGWCASEETSQLFWSWLPDLKTNI